jgi:thymidine phosphorylase
VESIPLIASSIMSKKIAEGAAHLVLDVKCGSGAFMKDLSRASQLARTMVELGADAGVDTIALVTDMSTPLGRTVGNALEVREAVEVLAGGGPSDVIELTLALAREMLIAGGSPAADPAAALADGRAMDAWRAMIKAQGGDPAAPLPQARHNEVITAPASGLLAELDALAIGLAAWRLGAGRARKEDPVQAGAGIELHAQLGDSVAAGQPLMTLWTDTPDRFDRVAELNLFKITPVPPRLGIPPNSVDPTGQFPLPPLSPSPAPEPPPRRRRLILERLTKSNAGQ